jgi:hypothetical protein
MNDLYNGLMSVTGGASAGLMLLVIFTSSDRASAECAAPQQWYTPLVDGTSAMAGIIGSLTVSLLGALCSFGALGDACSLSYYWLLPLSNATFVLCVLLCVLLRRLRSMWRGSTLSDAHGASARPPLRSLRLDDSAVASHSQSVLASRGGAELMRTA